MKLQTTTNLQVYKPVSLLITFETETELDNFQRVMRAVATHEVAMRYGGKATSDLLTTIYQKLESHTSAMA